jgi:ATP-binding cassette subfamily B protein
LTPAPPKPPEAQLREYRRVLPYLTPHLGALAFIILLSLFSTGASLAVPLLNQRLIDKGLLAQDMGALLETAAWMAGMTVVGFVLNIASSYAYVRVSAAVLFAMRLDMYQHLQQISPRHHAKTRLGDFVSRLTNDIAEVQRVTADTLLALLANVLFLVGAAVLMIRISGWLFVVGVAILPLTLWLVRKMQNRLAAHVRVLRERSAAIGSFLIESLTALRLTVLTNAQARESKRFGAENQSFVDALLRMQRTNFLAGAIPATAVTLSTTAVFLIGGRQVLDGTLTLGALIAFLAYHGRLLGPVQSLMSLYGGLVTGAVSLRRVHEIFEIPIEVRDGSHVPQEPFRGEIEFRDVRFEHVLQGTSFRLLPGQTYTLIGPSGAGKSTIADLIVRLFDATSGEILVDGQEIRQWPVATLREQIAVVEQTPILFNATVAENIAYSRPAATRAEIAAAASAAALTISLDQMAGERGTGLSAGERQRIAVARALLRDPRVLILDEPTAALDEATADGVMTTIREALKGRTGLLITHQPRAILGEVLELQQGRIVAPPGAAA